eukprot:PhF_6_TR18867/c0_g1_i1/m.27425
MLPHPPSFFTPQKKTFSPMSRKNSLTLGSHQSQARLQTLPKTSSVVFPFAGKEYRGVRYPANPREPFIHLSAPEFEALKQQYVIRGGLRYGDVQTCRLIMNSCGIRSTLMDDDVKEMMEVAKAKYDPDHVVSDVPMNITSFFSLMHEIKVHFVKTLGDPDKDTIDAFVATGGERDKSGYVQGAVLSQRCKEFNLTIDIESLIAEIDVDGNGTVDYDEFGTLLKNSSQGPKDATHVFQIAGGDPEDSNSVVYIEKLRSALFSFSSDPQNQIVLASLLDVITDEYVTYEQFYDHVILPFQTQIELQQYDIFSEFGAQSIADARGMRETESANRLGLAPVGSLHFNQQPLAPLNPDDIMLEGTYTISDLRSTMILSPNAKMAPRWLPNLNSTYSSNPTAFPSFEHKDIPKVDSKLNMSLADTLQKFMQKSATIGSKKTQNAKGHDTTRCELLLRGLTHIATISYHALAVVIRKCGGTLLPSNSSQRVYRAFRISAKNGVRCRFIVALEHAHSLLETHEIHKRKCVTCKTDFHTPKRRLSDNSWFKRMLKQTENKRNAELENKDPRARRISWSSGLRRTTILPKGKKLNSNAPTSPQDATTTTPKLPRPPRSTKTTGSSPRSPLGDEDSFISSIFELHQEVLEGRTAVARTSNYYLRRVLRQYKPQQQYVMSPQDTDEHSKKDRKMMYSMNSN